uniref:Uncharacterized protein n=1 Tax=Panagrolaimus davidi TaxID=227884 RepID=A0A914QY05_9BILA
MSKYLKSELEEFTPIQFIPPTRNEFFSTLCSQIFSLPKPIIYYISKNPSTSKVYQKMIRTCKYFFFQNPILIVKYISLDTFSDTYPNYSSKLWITDNFSVFLPYQNDFEAFLPKIFKCNAKTLTLNFLSLNFEDFKMLSNSAVSIDLSHSTIIKYKNGKDVELEKLIEVCPNVKIFNYELSPTICSTKTVKNLVKIPHFQFMRKFELSNIPESFEIQKILAFRKKKTNMRVEFYFCNELSEKYRCLLNFLEIKETFLGSTGLSSIRY